MSDGGRSRNNGDAAGGLTIISGPEGAVNNGVFGNLPSLNAIGNANQQGAEGTPYNLSNNAQERVLEHRHILSLVAKITHDIDTGVPYPLGISPKAT